MLTKLLKPFKIDYLTLLTEASWEIPETHGENLFDNQGRK